MIEKSISKERCHASLLNSLASKRHVLHAGEESGIIAAVGGARLAVARPHSGLLTVDGTTSGCVRVSSRVSTVVGRRSTIIRARWVVSAVVHRATTGGHVGVASGEGTVASVHLLCVLLALCPRRHAVGGLRSIGRKLVREGKVAIVIIALICVVTAATWMLLASYTHMSLQEHLP